MSIREANSVRVLAQGSTNGERIKNTFVNTILSQFNKNNPSFFEVTRNNNPTLIGALITDNVASASSEKLDTVKTILLNPNEILNVGDLFDYLDNKWLCLVAERFNDLYYKGFIQKTNNELKFYLNTLLAEVPCIIGKGTISLDTNKFLSLPADEYTITCSNTEQTRNITENTRFILSKNAYKVLGIDDISSIGLFNIRIKQDVISQDDNLELGIANYYSNQPNIPIASNGEVWLT